MNSKVSPILLVFHVLFISFFHPQPFHCVAKAAGAAFAYDAVPTAKRCYIYIFRYLDISFWRPFLPQESVHTFYGHCSHRYCYYWEGVPTLDGNDTSEDPGISGRMYDTTNS